MKIVYHNDADGECAGFWVRELAYAKELAYVTEYIGYIKMDYGREFPFDKIKKNETVYIVDYSIEPSEMDKLLEITPNVTWIDHHISAIKKYEKYDKEIRGVRYDGVAGCMLTYCYLKHMTNGGIGDIKPFEEIMTKDAPMFTKLIADYDVWTFNYGHLTKEFHAGLKAMPNTEPNSNCWLELNDPVYGYGATNALIKEGVSRIQYRKETMTHYCEAFGFEVMLNGYKCFAVNMGMISSDDFVINNIDDYDMLIVFAFNGHEWRYSLRSTKVDCSKVAMLYGGGGHKGAAGFNTKECVLINNNCNPTDDELELINRFTRRNLAKNEVYAFSVVLCDNDVDRDGERFTTDSLYELEKLFVGKTGIIDHNPSAKNQTARIFSCKVEKIDGQKTALGDDYYRLKARAYLPVCESNRDIILAFDSGIIKEVSVGCAVDRVVCNVCGEDISMCTHKKGEVYGSKLCCGELVNPCDAYEWSFVLPSKGGNND